MARDGWDRTSVALRDETSARLEKLKEALGVSSTAELLICLADADLLKVGAAIAPFVLERQRAKEATPANLKRKLKTIKDPAVLAQVQAVLSGAKA